MGNMSMMLRQRQAQGYNSPSGFGDLNPVLANLGYTMDGQGNIFYPDGTIMTGPAVLGIQRPRATGGGLVLNTTPLPTLDSIAARNPVYTLPNGQQLTAEQYQQLLAASTAQQQSGLTAGVTGAGINIGGSQIGWPLIIGGIVVIVLMQSRGFQRKER